MQIGSYNFTHLKSGMVFIQVANDGEGGEFVFNTLPAPIRVLLWAANENDHLTPEKHAELDALMAEFWKKYF